MKIHRFERYLYLFIPNIVLRRILPWFNKFRFFKETSSTSTPIKFDLWYNQKVKVQNVSAYWPVHHTSCVINANNIYCGIETCPGYSRGNYIQAIGKIYIGDYTSIAANVGIISANHVLGDAREHIEQEVRIGKYCWIGFGAVILPGVTLGDYTIVGAGSIVTKSFPEGYCVVGGNPAQKIKTLNKDECVFYRSENEYNGYIKSCNFENYRKTFLNV